MSLKIGGDTLGKKIQKMAEKLGLTHLPLTVLYARPRKIKRKPTIADEIFAFLQIASATRIPDVHLTIFKYLKRNLNDPSFKHKIRASGRSWECYYLVPDSNLYIEGITKLAGMLAVNPGNSVSQIKIYSGTEEYPRIIARLVNNLFEEGMLAHMDWKKLEKKFKVKREECIAMRSHCFI